MSCFEPVDQETTTAAAAVAATAAAAAAAAAAVAAAAADADADGNTGGDDTGNGDDIAAAVKIEPTLSTLPMGPLVSAVLYLTEGDVAQLLRTDKAMSSSPLCSDEFWRERCCSTFGRHLECLEALDKKAFRTFLRGKRTALDESIWSRDDFIQRSDQLLGTSVGASSQDMDDEVPRHTLMPSACWMMLSGGKVTTTAGQRCQSECGCVSFQKCYWSSEPSAVADKDEWLEYELADDLAVVSSFALTPYTSYWQPDQPTYNPVEACFQLTHPGVNQGKPYYESPRFRVEGSMTRQQFDLPQPTLSLGGRARILLLGMAQRQTIGPEAGETANHYHICISYAALQGAVLSCSVITTAQEILPTATGPAVDGSPSGTSRDVTQGGRGRGRAGDRQPDMRVRWAVTVRVAKCPQSHLRAGSGRSAGLKAEDSRLPVGRGVTMLKFEDTPCLEVVEEYLRKAGWQRPQGSKLELMSTSGRAFPGDAVLLKDFSDQGSLLLLDRSD